MINIQIKKKSINLYRILVPIILCSFALWSFPNLLQSVQAGLDPSWVLGIHMAKLQNLIFGTDILWTYGPLGYFNFPIFINYDLWIGSVLFTLFSHFLGFIILIIFSLKEKIPLKHVIIIGFLLLLFIKFGVGYFPIITLMLSCYLYLKYSRNVFLIPFLSFFSSILFLIKFDMALMSFTIMTVFSIYLLMQKKIYTFIIGLSSYLFFVLLNWTLSGGNTYQLFSYVSNSLMTTSGYSAAMSTDELGIIIIPLAIFAWVLISLILVTKKFRPTNSLLFFLSLTILFFLFKHGVVRDGPAHIVSFFLGWALLLYIYTSSKSKLKDYLFIKIISYGFIIILVLGAIVVTTPGISLEFLSNPSLSPFERLIQIFSHSKLESVGVYFNYIFNSDSLENMQIHEKNKLQSVYPLSATNKELIGANSIDIFPWDIAFLYAYDLNWQPRPSMQSYTDYTKQLDDVTAQNFLNNSTSPEFILYTANTIDGRFPFFDEPETLRSLICNYTIVGSENRFWLLEKNSNVCSEPEFLLSENITFNEKIKIPPNYSDLLYAKIFIEYNLLGELSEIFYKPPQIHFVADEDSYRFIQKPAQNGILLSLSNEAVKAFPMLNYDFKSFKLITDERFYKNNIRVEFYTLKGDFPIKSIHSNSLDVLLQIYYSRNDLQIAFPKVKNGDLSSLVTWAKTSGIHESFALKTIKPIIDLLDVFYSRNDLQDTFPEVIIDHNIDNLIIWAYTHGIYEEESLKLHSDFFKRFQ